MDAIEAQHKAIVFCSKKEVAYDVISLGICVLPIPLPFPSLSYPFPPFPFPFPFFLFLFLRKREQQSFMVLLSEGQIYGGRIKEIQFPSLRPQLERLCLRKTFPISSFSVPCLPAQLPVTLLTVSPQRVHALWLVGDSKTCFHRLYFGSHLKDMDCL